VSQRFVELGQKYNIPVHDIDLDHIGHYILWEWMELGYQKVRQELATEFGTIIMKSDGFIDTKALGNIVFWNEAKRHKLDEILKTPLQLQIRQEIMDKKWIILLNGALLAESGNTDLTNNNSVLIWVDQTTQNQRLQQRWHDSNEIDRRVRSQYSSQKKQEILQANITSSEYGSLLKIENNGNNSDEIETLFLQMVNKVDIYWDLRIKSMFEELWLQDSFIKVYHDLKSRYDTPERSYHNWFHIVACLNHLYDIKKYIDEQAFKEIFLSILYHDSIYDVQAKWGQNEIQSAQLAKKSLEDLSIDTYTIEKVIKLIETTAHHSVDNWDQTSAYMMDIDMSIVWSLWNIYEKYMHQVRQEYSYYSDWDYNKWRIVFLRGLLKKPVFSTSYFHERYHTQSQENIKKEILILESKIL